MGNRVHESGDGGRKTIVVVQDHDKHAEALRNAWQQLGLLEDLKITKDREQALQLVRESGPKSGVEIGAVVLDPDKTGEETGSFLRRIRELSPNAGIPVVLWTHDGQKYQVLEGRGVDWVLPKERILRLLHTLDDSCKLNVRDPHPFPGGAPGDKV